VSTYAIVGGNPARLIKFRFSEEEIDGLEKIAWWNWPDEKIIEALPLMMTTNKESFFKNFDSE